MTAQVLVIDVGTSGIRVAVMDQVGTITIERSERSTPDTPFPGLVEFDAAAMAKRVLALSHEVLARSGPVAAVGIANQRASTVVWDRATGDPVGPAIGWQDLRTVGECLAWQGQGLRLAPNQSATKAVHLLDAADPDRTRDLCFGTVDTWLAWTLTEGAAHVTDRTNAGVTGLLTGDAVEWNRSVLDALNIPVASMPRIVDSTDTVGAASALPGAPPITGMVGDQQASMIGQGCVRPGAAKITFGTGGMLDMWLGDRAPDKAQRSAAGTFPIVALGHAGTTWWGLEAIMLSAGTNVDWLCEDLGLIPDAASSHEVAASCPHTDGVVYVPALLGLGTPRWDYGARGALFGVTRGTTAAHIVRAVLEGVAQRGADLVEAAEADAQRSIEVLHVDGGMSDNPTFVQAVADATQRPVEVSPEREATTVGAGYAAQLGAGLLDALDAMADRWSPRARIEPGEPTDRERWADAIDRAAGWHRDLSSLDF